MHHQPQTPRAHPRVSGENNIVLYMHENTIGSSPRERGKRLGKHPNQAGGRLIPA